MGNTALKTVTIFNLNIHNLSKNEAEKLILKWGESGESKYICFCNSHTVHIANKNKEVREVLNCADLSLPDGFPLAWGMRMKGICRAERIAGPDMMNSLCRHAEKKGLRIFLYGGDAQTLNRLTQKLRKTYCQLNIVGSFSPPFGKINAEDERKYQDFIKNARPNIVFVGLGFPKQEIWMAKAKQNVKAVMLGVGAAFDFIAGTKKRAPKWVQSIGMEWFWRMIKEPQRLTKRYMLANSHLIIMIIEKLIKR